MRSWVFSAGLIAPVSTKRPVPWAKTGACGRRQPDGQPSGGDVVDRPVPGVGCGGAVVDEPLVQGQLWEQPVLRRPADACCRGLLCRYLSCACLAGQSAASRSGWPSACSCSRLMSLGGWDAAATASGPVRPTSPASPGCAARAGSTRRSSSPVTGHRVAGVIVRPVPLGEDGPFQGRVGRPVAVPAVAVRWASRPGGQLPGPRPGDACHRSRRRLVRGGIAGLCRGGWHPGCAL